jgi:hypothetical protein
MLFHLFCAITTVLIVEILGKEYDTNKAINTMAKEKKIWYICQTSS